MAASQEPCSSYDIAPLSDMLYFDLKMCTVCPSSLAHRGRQISLFIYFCCCIVYLKVSFFFFFFLDKRADDEKDIVSSGQDLVCL